VTIRTDATAITAFTNLRQTPPHLAVHASFLVTIVVVAFAGYFIETMACTLARVSAAPPQCRPSSSLRPHHHHQPRRPAAPRLATLATANPGPHPLAATRRETLQLALSAGIALALPVRPAGAIVAPPQGDPAKKKLFHKCII
jgi:hypothetical protein